MKTLIIGYGSTLRSDDGIGYRVAEKLMDLFESPSPARDLPPPHPEVLARQQLTPDLADSLSRVDRVIFIDASATSAPGEIRCQDIAPSGKPWGAFVHEMPPDILLDCVQELYGHIPQAILITIGMESFAIGEQMTPKIAAALPTLIDLVLQECRKLPA